MSLPSSLTTMTVAHFFRPATFRSHLAQVILPDSVTSFLSWAPTKPTASARTKTNDSANFIADPLDEMTRANTPGTRARARLPSIVHRASTFDQRPGTI